MWVISKCSGQFFFLHLSSRHAFLYITADHRLNYRSHPLFSLVCDFSTARENMLSVKSALQCVSCLLFIFLLNPRPLVYHNHHKNLPDYSFSTPTHLSAHPLPLFFSQFLLGMSEMQVLWYQVNDKLQTQCIYSSVTAALKYSHSNVFFVK